MSSILYLDCSSGISGDMTVAALLDLGADEKVLKKALDSLDTEGFEVRISRVKKGGIEACDFQVILDSAHDGHDHDMEYLHGPGHDKEEKQEQAHSHRGLAQILETIHKAQMTQGARKLASGIFHILAQAEAKAHGVSVKEVHFHEVGAVDSIVDIVAAAVCLDNLGIHQVAVPVLCDPLQARRDSCPRPGSGKHCPGARADPADYRGGGRIGDSHRSGYCGGNQDYRQAAPAVSDTKNRPWRRKTDL